VLEGVVEGGHSGGDSLPEGRVGSRITGIRQAGEDLETLGGDAVQVVTGEKGAAAEFPDAQKSTGPFGGTSGFEGDDGIRDRELRRSGGLGGIVFTYPQGRNGQGGEPPGQLAQEATEGCLVRGEALEGFEAVDDDQAGLPGFEQAIDSFEHAPEPVVDE